MTNIRIALAFERVAELLEQQGASPFRARAWREAADAIREQPRELSDVFRDHGRVGLEAIPHVGPHLAAVLIELIKTGRCGALERLQGDPIHTLASVPGLGPQLAERIHRELGIATLEELETAAHDGRLSHVAGIGPRRIAAQPTRAWHQGARHSHRACEPGRARPAGVRRPAGRRFPARPPWRASVARSWR
jgi:DNA polymerase/3'-5' exonuclease PolX